MGAKKKRALVPPPLKSLKRARQITSAFHAAEHGRTVDGPPPDRAAYQDASQTATARHRTTSRFVFSSLTALGVRRAAGCPRPAVLEIGAVNTQLLACPWLAVRAIDIRPSARGIEACDFFSLGPPQPGGGGGTTFDVVVCAMVLNCVATPARRGDMLVRMRACLTAPGGVAIVALPRRCVERGGGGVGGARPHPPAASSSPSDEACAARWAPFEAAMAAAGLAPVLARKASPKIAFWAVGVGQRAAGGWGKNGMMMGSDFGVVVPPVETKGGGTCK